MKRATM